MKNLLSEELEWLGFPAATWTMTVPTCAGIATILQYANVYNLMYEDWIRALEKALPKLSDRLNVDVVDQHVSVEPNGNVSIEVTFNND